MRWGWVITIAIVWWIIVDPTGAANTAHTAAHGITTFFQSI